MSPEPAPDDLCALSPTDKAESEECVKYCWDTCGMLTQVLELLTKKKSGALSERRVYRAKKMLREAIGRCMPDGYGEL